MNVRRTLPQRGRTTIGAWCFADHYGPDDVATSGGMVVPPHPHTGLQTVSWLFEGEIEHRDSAGSHELVRPGAREPHDGGARHRALRGVDPGDDAPARRAAVGGPARGIPPHRPVLRARRDRARRRSATRPCACSSARFPASRRHRRHRVLAAARRPGRPARRRQRRARRSTRRSSTACSSTSVRSSIEADGADAATEVAWSDLAYLEPGRPRLVLRAGRRPAHGVRAARRRAVRRGARDVVELHRPQPRRDRRVPARSGRPTSSGATTPTAGSARSRATTAIRCRRPSCRRCG